MRFVELICFSVVLAVFSSGMSGLLYQIRMLDKRAGELKKRTDILLFVSESFYNTCQGKGFSSLEEWKSGCGVLLKLDEIDWEVSEKYAGGLYCGKWKSPYGNGEVYFTKDAAQEGLRKAGKSNERKN